MLLTVLLPFLLLEVGVLSLEPIPCPGIGVFPHPRINTKFLICSETKNSTSSLSSIVSCPENYIFNEEERTCVKKDGGPHLARMPRAVTDQCQTEGPVCTSCDLLMVCANVNGKLTSLANITCSEASSGSVCEESVKGCKQADATTKCQTVPKVPQVRCLLPGFFPDPTDCKKYHICDDKLNHYEDTCDGKYDALKNECVNTETCVDTNTDNPCRPDSLFSRAVSSNPSFYTVCLPVATNTANGGRVISYQWGIVQCPNNTEFNDATYSCEYVCKTRPDRIPDPSDCHKYYDCPKDTQNPPVKKTCSQGLAFERTKKLCIPESSVSSCPQNRVITTRAIAETDPSDSVSTATIPSSSNTTETTQSTASTSAPTDTTETTAQITISTAGTTGTTAVTQQITRPVTPATTSRRCREGEKWADPSDCRSYYECTRGRVTRSNCLFYSKFNPSFRACIFSLYPVC